MFPEANKYSQYLAKKTCENYPYNRKDTMNKIIASHINYVNKTFDGTFMGIPLDYTVCYHHCHY